MKMRIRASLYSTVALFILILTAMFWRVWFGESATAVNGRIDVAIQGQEYESNLGRILIAEISSDNSSDTVIEYQSSGGRSASYRQLNNRTSAGHLIGSKMICLWEQRIYYANESNLFSQALDNAAVVTIPMPESISDCIILATGEMLVVGETELWIFDQTGMVESVRPLNGEKIFSIEEGNNRIWGVSGSTMFYVDYSLAPTIWSNVLSGEMAAGYVHGIVEVGSNLFLLVENYVDSWYVTEVYRLDFANGIPRVSQQVQVGSSMYPHESLIIDLKENIVIGYYNRILQLDTTTLTLVGPRLCTESQISQFFKSGDALLIDLYDGYYVMDSSDIWLRLRLMLNCYILDGDF